MGARLGKVIGAAQRAASRLHGGQIIYRRGDEEVWIRAVFGRTPFEIDDAGTVRIEYTDRDFIFPAEALILGGERALPERGDRITVVAEEHIDEQVFEVLAPGGEQVYRFSDPQGYRIRVHTKRIT